MSTQAQQYDYVIIGSGFGGSVSALRLAEKGYKVLVIEKGKWFKSHDFPETNWNLRKWMWLPSLGMQGLFKLTFYRHVAVLSGVGVGGGGGGSPFSRQAAAAASAASTPQPQITGV